MFNLQILSRLPVRMMIKLVTRRLNLVALTVPVRRLQAKKARTIKSAVGAK
jgi:hypothetical protein